MSRPLQSERMATHQNFLIGGHLVSIGCMAADDAFLHLLPSFAPFILREEASLGDTPTLLSLTICQSLPPTSGRKLLRPFDTGNGVATLYQLPGEGYEIEMADGEGKTCSILSAHEDFTKCLCALSGTPVQRAFGLNSALMTAYAFAAGRHDTLLVHASCITHEGKAYPFMAPSGTGKSTHTALWLTHVDGAQLLNDDNPIVRLERDGVFVYGSPWSGKTPCYRPQRMPLGALTQIRRAPSNAMARLHPAPAFAALLTACPSMCWDTGANRRTHDTLSRLIATIPVFTLRCLPNGEAALLCHETLAQCNG